MKAVFLVEGTHDADKIHSAFEGNENIKTIVTEGTKVNGRVKKEIESYLEQNINVYILSDPDSAGDMLSDMVQYYYPEIPRVVVDLQECAYFTGKKMKAGIEYSSHRYLRKILSPYVGLTYVEETSPICWD